MTKHFLPLELAIWKELAGASLSVSHDRWHIDRVLDYALQLQAVYGGDRDVLVAAVLMHDLGRADPNRQHGLASIQASAEGAEQILEAIHFPAEKRPAVLGAISEHDQPELRPESTEARILKDADFLAGFGAWGLLRIAMWSGETGRNTKAVLDRLENGMPRRMAHLEFPESRKIAHREMFLVKVFLGHLRSSPPVTEDGNQGKYIVLEGISGSGKDTQAQRLADRLTTAGYIVESVAEPTDDYRYYKGAFESITHSHLDDSDVKKWLLIASRARLMKDTVRPALAANKIVLSVRSFVSTLVYQCDSDQAVADTAYLHREFPQPDVLVLLDVPASEARSRIANRKKPEGDYESPIDLQRFSDKYRAVCQKYFPLQTYRVAATGDADHVAERVWEAVASGIRG